MPLVKSSFRVSFRDSSITLTVSFGITPVIIQRTLLQNLSSIAFGVAPWWIPLENLKKNLFRNSSTDFFGKFFQNIFHGYFQKLLQRVLRKFLIEILQKSFHEFSPQLLHTFFQITVCELFQEIILGFLQKCFQPFLQKIKSTEFFLISLKKSRISSKVFFINSP